MISVATMPRQKTLVDYQGNDEGEVTISSFIHLKEQIENWKRDESYLPTYLPTYLLPTTYYLLPTTYEPLSEVDPVCFR